MEFDAVFEPISGEMQLVERELKSQLGNINYSHAHNPAQLGYLEKTVTHLFGKAGKRLRPALVILSAKSVAGTANSINLARLAAAVELLHSASLVHDDVIDSEKYRRQQISLNQKYGNQIAVLVGDLLYTQSFSLLTELSLPLREQKTELFRIFCNTTQCMCLAEIKEQRLVNEKIDPTISEYLEILENKTAVLMSACCRSGGMLVSADEPTLQALANYGLNFGLAYQLIDDHIDGDAILCGEMDMVERAREYVSLARESLTCLEDNETKRGFSDLCELLIDNVKAPSRYREQALR